MAMHRALLSRVFARSQQAQRVALKRSVVAARGASLAPREALWQRVGGVRSFQTTCVLLRDEDEKKAAHKAEDSDDEYEEEDWSDEEDEQEEDWSDEDEEQEEAELDGEVDAEAQAMAAQYLGVKYSPTKVKKYSAELELDGLVISGGDYWTALDAAKGYDELVDLYCDLETPRNFPAGSQDAEAAAGAAGASMEFSPSGEAEWEVPDAGKRHADIIPVIEGTHLTLDEVLAALEREKAIDVYTVNLQGKSSLADYMIFTTGRSQAHMRRMADMMIQSMKARNLQDDFEYAVEGRDCDDWMIADCSNIVVHFMREDTRRILNLEDHWENMENDKHKIYGDMTEDEYMDKFGTSELMEYVEDDDFVAGDSPDGERLIKGGDIEWK